MWIAVEGIPQAVLDRGAVHLEIAHLHAIAQMRTMRRYASADFLAARDHDLGVAIEDGLIAERDRAARNSAELVDALHAFIDAGRDRSLAGGIWPCSAERICPGDDLGDLARPRCRPLESGP